MIIETNLAHNPFRKSFETEREYKAKYYNHEFCRIIARFVRRHLAAVPTSFSVVYKIKPRETEKQSTSRMDKNTAILISSTRGEAKAVLEQGK